MTTIETLVAENPQQYISPLDSWQKLPDFLNNHPQFSLQQMRWLLLHRKTNGLSKCIRKIGKPIYINASEFCQWIEEEKNNG